MDKLAEDMSPPHNNARYVWKSFRNLPKNEQMKAIPIVQYNAQVDMMYTHPPLPVELNFETYAEWAARFPYALTKEKDWNYFRQIHLQNPDKSRQTTNPLSANPSLSHFNGYGGSRGSQKTRFKKRNLRKYKSIKKSKKRSFRKRRMY